MTDRMKVVCFDDRIMPIHNSRIMSLQQTTTKLRIMDGESSGVECGNLIYTNEVVCA